MNFFTAPIMPPPPRVELTCAQPLWNELLLALRERGAQGRRESGAFLLGERFDDQAHVREFVLYDDLDPQSLDSGIVRFDGRYYGVLWARCRERALSVVADVHTHPFGSQQSRSDRAHPMISTAGHIALIVPHFAMGNVVHEQIGIYLYLGAKRWYTVPMAERPQTLNISSREPHHD